MLYLLLQWGFPLILIIFGSIWLWLIKTNIDPDVKLFEEEKHFIDAQKKKVLFPEPFSAAPIDDIYLSLVVPAYNEEKRLNPMMEETIQYCTKRRANDPKFTFEIIIVSDGSSDRTVDTAMKWVDKYPSDVRVMGLIKNRGKGGAVKRGMMVSRGKHMLLMDADGATKFSDLEKLEAGLKSVVKKGHGICVGSRAHLQGQAEAKRSFFRNVLTWGFHLVVKYIGGVTTIRDTQCGFKLFTRATANLIFPPLHLERWAFDVELLWIALSYGIPIHEVSVSWTEIAGSHLEEEDTRVVSIRMFMDLARVRFSYLFRIWPSPKSKVC